MLKVLLFRPIGVFMTTLAVVIISLVFVNQIPVSLLPDIPVPTIAVQVDAPDIDPRTLENTVTRTLRNHLLQVNHLSDLHSQTRSGSVLIELSLDYGVNTNLSYIEITEKIDQVMHLLPRNIERPRVIMTNVSDIPVSHLQITPRPGKKPVHSMLELSDFAEKVIKRRLEQLNEIAFTDIHGRVFPEVIVRPDQKLLIALGITEEKLAQAILDANVELGNVLIQDGAYQYHIRLRSRLISVEDIESLYLRIGKRLFQMKDLASVTLGEEIGRSSFFRDGLRGIVLSVYKKSNANNFILHYRMRELLSSLETEYPSIRFEISNDQTRILLSSIGSLKTSLLYGLTFAGLILFAFFRNGRTPLMIMITVPVSLLITLFCFHILGISINIISLAGLILGIGLMIDNSIIIIENILQWTDGDDDVAAVVSGVHEVIRPLISSALTTSSVFLPLIFLSGLAGALFYDLALSITIALAVSLAVSYFILPVMVNIVLIQSKEKIFARVPGLHEKAILWCVEQKKWLLPAFLLTGSSIFFFFPRIPKESFPDITYTDYVLKVDWNEQIDLKENERRGRQLYEAFGERFDGLSAYTGELQFLLVQNEQDINETTYLVSKTDGNVWPHLDEMTQMIDADFPSAVVKISPADNVFDRLLIGHDAEIIAAIQSGSSLTLPDYEDIQSLIKEVKDLLPGTEPPPVNTYISLEVLYDKLLIYNISYDKVVSKLRSILASNRISELRTSDRFIPIQIWIKDHDDLRSLLTSHSVRTPGDQSISLSHFIDVRIDRGYKNIQSGRSGEHIQLTTDKYVSGMEESLIERIRAFGPYSVQFSGNYYTSRELIGELLRIALVVLVILYLILAAQFESFVQPFIVALTLPVGVLGALLCLYIAGESLNMMAMVGIIIMCGIDVNDAILKIDLINQNRRMGVPLLDAIIDGSGRRIRPIIMTSLTTILAMTPVLFSSGLGAELQRPLALAVIGGLGFGTIASVVMVPMLYSFLASLEMTKKRFARLFSTSLEMTRSAFGGK